MPRDGNLIYVDNLRIVLTVLVLLHHIAASYGDAGAWYYHEPVSGPGSAIFFTFLMAINQSFFMGCFFLLAGYFVPPSLERKGTRAFVGDRLLRLGLPLAAFFLVVNPLTVRLAGHGGWHVGPGPMWFVEILLLFTLVYVLVRPLLSSAPILRITRGSSTVFVLTTGLVTFLIRTRWPVDQWLEIPTLQPAHATQYVALFAVGLWASGAGLAERLTPELTRYWRRAMGLASVAVLVAFISADTPGDGKTSLDPLIGGWTWQSLVTSLWEQVFAVGLITNLLAGFHERCDQRGFVLGSAAAAAYTVYILHPLVLVPLCSALSGLPVPSIAKFALIAPAAVVICFGLAHWIRKAPLVRRALRSQPEPCRAVGEVDGFLVRGGDEHVEARPSAEGESNDQHTGGAWHVVRVERDDHGAMSLAALREGPRPAQDRGRLRQIHREPRPGGILLLKRPVPAPIASRLPLLPTGREALMSDLVLVVESSDGRMLERPLSGLETIGVEAGAAYALIDATTGMPPEGLQLSRKGADLEIEVNQETVVRIDDFYAEDLDVTFSLDGSALSVAPMVTEAAASAEGLVLPDAVDVAAGAEGADDEGADVAANAGGLFGFVGWNWATALVAGGAAGAGAGAAAIIDHQGGSSSSAAGPVPDSIVVFDLTTGESSSHSGRVFQDDVAYTIYVRVDSQSGNLSSPPMWTGTLGADDQIILVGTGTDVIGRSADAVTSSSVNSSEGFSAHWRTNSEGFNREAASLQNGYLYRKYGYYTSSGSETSYTSYLTTSSDTATLWSASTTGTFDVGYLTSMPAGVLTSQGLGVF